MARNRRRSTKENEEKEAAPEKVFHPRSIKSLSPRNEHQDDYLRAIENNTLTIGYGPAGTGKTWLAVYQALKHHFSKVNGIKRIIISRPAVEAGEKLGFLPGSLEDKVDPYMRPIYDALYDLLGVDLAKAKIERGYIEIAPIAFLRGRTFKDAFIIIDEAQNATLTQLKMVVTRIGENSKMVLTGDPDQTDLVPSRGVESGLNKLVEIIKERNVEDVGIVSFGREDVVRSKIVTSLVSAFEDYEKDHPSGNGK